MARNDENFYGNISLFKQILILLTEPLQISYETFIKGWQVLVSTRSHRRTH